MIGFVLVDPPAIRYSAPDEIAAWIHELEELMEAAGDDEAAFEAYARAKADAKRWHSSALEAGEVAGG